MEQRAVNLPPHLKMVPVRTDGTYIVVTKDFHWGRGDTLEQALAEARKAGAQSTAKKNVLVYWQPNSSWQENKVKHGKGDKPFINEEGTVVSWGKILPEILYHPQK